MKPRALTNALYWLLSGLTVIAGLAAVWMAGVAAVAALDPGFAATILEGFPEAEPDLSPRLVAPPGLALIALFIALAAFVFDGLRRVAATVRSGSAFDPANPGRLRRIALLLAAQQLAGTVMAFVAESDDYDIAGWIAVLAVLVLAEVFREGARLRRQAELTV